MMTISEIQEHVRRAWTNETYSKEFNASPVEHKDFAHAVLHILKAAGKLAAIVDDLDHGKPVEESIGKFVGDLIICAARIANCTGKHLGLCVQNRLQEKLPLRNWCSNCGAVLEGSEGKSSPHCSNCS